ncbi:SGNH/GDSL hydrolase family protein [Actinophytocola xanthii]|uniref:GDSL family lipase n=1 Tax=Actinophytocola xanthii TaxID=1912961 RepID=A0A1Q8CPI8_9PSEU|nr:SGNH/GDSL hydrolase family protein [Actinophytocola xanthii]OLF16285.1 GDSL family lipase [Actinophytocola xanthii]
MPHGRERTRFLALLVTALLLLCAGIATGDRGSPPARGSWVGSWASVPTAAPVTATPVLDDQTIRQVVHLSLPGDRVRLRLTNEFGTEPLRLGEVHLARRAGTSGTDIVPATDRRVTFSGEPAVTIPAGAPMLSDPVPLAVPARADLVVSIHLPEHTPVTTLHSFALQENAVADGNVTDDESVAPVRTVTQWYFLSGVAVHTSARGAAAVVAFGDSITNGFSSEQNANNRWPDLLAERVRGLGTLNLGVAGNRLLHDPNPPPGSEAENFAVFFGQSALRRFDRDVLSQPGARHLVVLLGVNDLGHPGSVAPISETVSAREIIAAHRQIIARAHEAGLRVYGGTILPFEGTPGFSSEENLAKWAEVNDWIRTGGEYDAVIDFAAAVADPADPERLAPAYDSGDHLHPNDAGMARMAATVPGRLFR